MWEQDTHDTSTAMGKQGNGNGFAAKQPDIGSPVQLHEGDHGMQVKPFMTGYGCMHTCY
jgi:hypothetical protein